MSVSGEGSTGTYTLSLVQVDADDYADDTTTTATVTVGGSANARVVAPFDRDWFEVQLAANQGYRITVRGNGFRGNVFGLYDSAGEPVIEYTESTDGSIWGRITDPRSSDTIYVTTAGTYYISAGHAVQSEQNHVIGTYSVEVRTSTANANNTTTMDTAAAAGTLTSGTAPHAGWQAWYRVELAANTAYAIRMITDIATDSDGDRITSQYFDPWIYGIFDSEGHRVFDPDPMYQHRFLWDDDGGSGLDSCLVLTTTDAGNYYIGTSIIGSHSGNFNLSVTAGGNCN